MEEKKSKKRGHHILTVTAIERAKKPTPPQRYKFLRDGDSLELRISASGEKIWRVQYYVYGGEKPQKTACILGTYPELSLAMARKEAEKVKENGKKGINASQKKTIDPDKEKQENRTFKDIAEEWLEDEVDTSKATKSTKTLKRRMLEIRVFPVIGHIVFKELTYKHYYKLLIDIYKSDNNKREKSSYSLRLSEMICQIEKWAKKLGYTDKIATEGLSEDMRKKEVILKHRAALLEPVKIGEFLKKIEAEKSKGLRVYSEAIELIVYLPVRSLELRGAKRDEFDFDKKLWRIPAERVKIRKEILLPLPEKIAVKINELINSNGDIEYVFPTKKRKGEITFIHDQSMNEKLRRMGYTKDELEIHGFRSTFSTIMNETGLYGQDVIEAVLSHTIGNKVSRAYNRSDYLDKKRECLEDYCYILDELKKGRDFDSIKNKLKLKHIEKLMKQTGKS